MPSFQITVTPRRRAAVRFIGSVRRTLQRALAGEGADNGLNQSEIARRLEVHRSVVSRELRGQKDISMGRVGELAWALGLEPHFELKKSTLLPGDNNKISVTESSSLVNDSVFTFSKSIST